MAAHRATARTALALADGAILLDVLLSLSLASLSKIRPPGSWIFRLPECQVKNTPPFHPPVTLGEIR